MAFNYSTFTFTAGLSVRVLSNVDFISQLKAIWLSTKILIKIPTWSIDSDILIWIFWNDPCFCYLEWLFMVHLSQTTHHSQDISDVKCSCWSGLGTMEKLDPLIPSWIRRYRHDPVTIPLRSRYTLYLLPFDLMYDVIKVNLHADQRPFVNWLGCGWTSRWTERWTDWTNFIPSFILTWWG